MLYIYFSSEFKINHANKTSYVGKLVKYEYVQFNVNWGSRKKSFFNDRAFKALTPPPRV